MRKIRIMEHISLDGVIQHSADDGDFPYSDWTAPYRTPAGRDAMLAAYGESFDLLLGRRTYDIWSDFWPKAPSSPMADGLNAATKYVATHHPESLEWGPFEGLGLDIVEGIRRIKSQDGPDLILSGSSTLTSALLENGDPVAALASYEKQRLEATTRIVLTNRTNPPDAILREVFQRTNDQPFAAIDDVISRDELVALSEGYKRIAGYSKEALRR